MELKPSRLIDLSETVIRDLALRVFPEMTHRTEIVYVPGEREVVLPVPTPLDLSGEEPSDPDPFEEMLTEKVSLSIRLKHGLVGVWTYETRMAYHAESDRLFVAVARLIRAE